MNVIFRVDSSKEIGSGHVMRCLTLAEQIRKYGHKVIFISRNLEGNFLKEILQKKFILFILPYTKINNDDSLYYSQWLSVDWETDAQQTTEIINSLHIQIDWLIIDHYAIDYKWEQILRKNVKKILVIDDLADRNHECEILLDQNYYPNLQTRYDENTNVNTLKILGPKNAIIRDEFVNERNKKKLNRRISDIFIFFGGSDPTNETLKVIKILKKNELLYKKVHVIVGKNNVESQMIKKFCEENPRFEYHYNIDYMAKLMKICDFAICAGGSTTWERYTIGLPGIVISVAYNQIEICRSLENLSVDIYLGNFDQYCEEELITAIKNISSVNSIQFRSERAMTLIDGLGKIRIVQSMENYNNVNGLDEVLQ